MVSISLSGGMWVKVAASAVAIVLLGAQGNESPREGLYSVHQAQAGRLAYGTYCSNCHGVDLMGPQAPLKGPAFLSLGRDNGMTIGTFFDFIVRDTPAGRVDSLSHDEYLAIMAYILSQNGYAAGRSPLRFERAMHERTLIGARH